MRNEPGHPKSIGTLKSTAYFTM